MGSGFLVTQTPVRLEIGNQKKDRCIFGLRKTSISGMIGKGKRVVERKPLGIVWLYVWILTHTYLLDMK